MPSSCAPMQSPRPANQVAGLGAMAAHAAATKPILIVEGEIHRAVDAAVAVLSDPAIGVYARGGDLVRVVRDPAQARTLTVAKRGGPVSRATGALTIVPLNEAALVETLTRNARFEKWSVRANMFVPCNCPVDVARMILAAKGHGWTIPRLRAVISAPTLRPDGSVLDQPGYDTATCLLLAGDRLRCQMPEQPAKSDALEALDVLAEPLDGFPFVDNSDRSAAFALLISAVLRPALRTVPMFAITAPAAGTGKSLLVDLAAILAIGRTAAVVTPTSDEAELEKRIGATALAGDQVLSIDNITHVLRSDQLCQMLTQDEVQVRILGASKNARVPSTGLICATGNNLAIYGDLNRRTVRIRLDARCEKPDERRFDVDVISVALSKRDALVTAALTVIRAYLLAGAPDRAAPMGSFEAWSDTVRSALIWLGMGDCRGDIDAMRAGDPEKAELAEIIAALPTYYSFTTKDVARKVAVDEALKETFETFMGRGGVFSTKRFGRYLARFEGTVVGGRRIEKVANDVHGATWRVVDEGVSVGCSGDQPLRW